MARTAAQIAALKKAQAASAAKRRGKGLKGQVAAHKKRGNLVTAKSAYWASGNEYDHPAFRTAIKDKKKHIALAKKGRNMIAKAAKDSLKPHSKVINTHGWSK